MNNARIYKFAKNPMQSGKSSCGHWILEFIPENSKYIEPIMGWTASTDTLSQVKLSFNNREEAVSYAERNNIKFEITEPKENKLKLNSYIKNFL